jgi:hypothetical protein
MKDDLGAFIPMVLRRRGVQRITDDKRHVRDVTLLEGLARAFYWQHLLDIGAMKTGADIARAEGLHSSVINELLRLTLLAPDIIEKMMIGKQPRRLTLMWFQRNRLPVGWQVQREIMGTFEGDL